MESSRRDLLNDMAEHRPTLKNNQNTYHPRFSLSRKLSKIRSGGASSRGCSVRVYRKTVSLPSHHTPAGCDLRTLPGGDFDLGGSSTLFYFHAPNWRIPRNRCFVFTVHCSTNDRCCVALYAYRFMRFESQILVPPHPEATFVTGCIN